MRTSKHTVHSKPKLSKFDAAYAHLRKRTAFGASPNTIHASDSEDYGSGSESEASDGLRGDEAHPVLVDDVIEALAEVGVEYSNHVEMDACLQQYFSEVPALCSREDPSNCAWIESGLDNVGLYRYSSGGYTLMSHGPFGKGDPMLRVAGELMLEPKYLRRAKRGDPRDALFAYRIAADEIRERLRYPGYDGPDLRLVDASRGNESRFIKDPRVCRCDPDLTPKHALRVGVGLRRRMVFWIRAPEGVGQSAVRKHRWTLWLATPTRLVPWAAPAGPVALWYNLPHDVTKSTLQTSWSGRD